MRVYMVPGSPWSGICALVMIKEQGNLKSTETGRDLAFALEHF